jgi:hypothetical protein
MLAALAGFVLLAGGFVFTGVQAWKWSEGRQENIPALSATLDNQTGKDWSEVEFRVKVACAGGGESSYRIVLRNVAPGRREVRETAFDAIGSVRPCDGTAVVEFVRGVEMPESQRPAYAVLGFAMEHADGPPTSELEGILDYRHRSDSDVHTRPVYWNEGGFSFTLPERPDLRWYVFRVEPGNLGLAGFLLNRDPQSTGPLSRFLRTYPVAPGSAALLGVFRVHRGTRSEVGVTLEPAGEFEAAIREIVRGRLSRPLERVTATRPKKDSPVVNAH